MIPGKTLTPQQFADQYPPSGSRGRRSFGRTESGTDHLSIINDIPLKARSCFVYDNEVLKKYGGDSTYPLPDEFNHCRKLNSLEAVVKQIGPGKTVFSHMYVGPEDVEMIFGKNLMSVMKSIQRDVRASSVA